MGISMALELVVAILGMLAVTKEKNGYECQKRAELIR